MLHWQEMLTHQSQYPTTQTRELLPFSNPCPMISPQLLCCCATLLSVSWMPMKAVQTNEHQMYRAYHLMFTLDLSSLQQHRRLVINLACIHWLCHQHDKTAEHVKCILTYLTSLAKLFAARSVPVCDSSTQCVDCPCCGWSVRRCDKQK